MSIFRSRHSQGQRFACPCRCGEPRETIGTVMGGVKINPTVHRPTLPTWYRLRGAGGRQSPPSARTEMLSIISGAPGGSLSFTPAAAVSPKWR
jgi:hypothetical protein